MPRAGLRPRSFLAWFVISLLLVAACQGNDTDDVDPRSTLDAGPTTEAPAGMPSPPPPETATAAAEADRAALIEARPYRLVEPEDFDEDEPAPLILVLHGYGQGEEFSDHFDLDPVASEHNALVAYPLGTPDAFDRRFWNATDVCCDFFRRSVDDVAYLGAVIDDVVAKYRVDAKRIFVVGYSNGAFMAQRLACELDDRIAAVVAVAGVNWLDPTLCAPSEAVAVLQVHGDADPVVQYSGGRMADGAGVYPSVQASIEGWRDRNGCGEAAEVTESALDIATNLDGVETSVTRYSDCVAGGAAELWTVHGGDHDIEFGEAFAEAVWDFLEAHPKP